jgi:CubicO group peptidase (beta-lactamase class C family)
MAIRSALLGILAGLPLCAAHAAASAPAAAKIVRAKALLASFERSGEPGCVVGVSKGGSWLFKGAFGLANLEDRAPNSPELIFGVASVTKQFTAAAAAIAAHRGYFSLDDDIRKYLPEIPDYGVPITIRDLIHHTNGLRDHGRLVGLTGKPHGFPSMKSRVALLARQRATNFPAGTEFRYGNTGYLFLAEIIERTTGRPLAQFAQENIFAPLGMTQTYFGVKTRGVKGRAIPYSHEPAGWRNTDEDFGVAADYGSGGILTTLDDYAKWANNLFAADSKLPGGAELTQRLRAPGRLQDGTPVPYGFGLRLDPYRGHALVSHSGSGAGYKALAMMFPESALGVFGFCNNGVYAQPVVMAFADLFLDLPPEDPAQAGSAALDLSPGQLQKFAGTYREPALRLPMIVKAGRSSLTIDGDAITYEFKPIAPTRFRNEENIVIEFDGAQGGATRYLKQIQGRKYGTGRFERIDVVAPTRQQLSDYAGDYFSAELSATYRFSIEQGRLHARILDAEAGVMPFDVQAMLRDEFVCIQEQHAFRFVRAAGGTISGFDLTHQFGWITDLRFERVR